MNLIYMHVSIVPPGYVMYEIINVILWLDHRTIEFAVGYFAVFNAEYRQC